MLGSGGGWKLAADRFPDFFFRSAEVFDELTGRLTGLEPFGDLRGRHARSDDHRPAEGDGWIDGDEPRRLEGRAGIPLPREREQSNCHAPLVALDALQMG